jgi:Protein kinase domain
VLVDGTGQSKLTDFGVAARAGQDAAAGGTPLYMAPEQWDGGPATPATDIYAATVVFFECLTGMTPFSGALGQLAAQHAAAAVPVGLVDEPLRGLVARGMAKDPVARPADASRFVAELEATAAAAYGAGWEERGRGRLAERAAALSLLLLPHGGAAGAGTGTAATSSRLPAAVRTATRAGRAGSRAWLHAGIAAAVIGVAAGSVAAVALSGGHARAGASRDRGPVAPWQLTGSMATGHGDWHNGGFAQLPDGRVLAISGSAASGTLTPTAEVYDPGTGRWTSAGALHDARQAFGPPSVLPDGDVLVAGGTDVNVVDYASAELYDPATNQWALTGSLNTARRYPVQVELANGEVLVATGSHGLPTCTRYLSSAELYNPATGQWTYTGSTLVPRESATAIRLADGRVLLAGGYNGGGSACTDTDPVDTETYDPATGQWSAAGNLPHGWLGGTMVLLPDHRVLMVDGNQSGSGPFAEAVIFDPATSQWSEAATPILPRSGANATLLPDGKVLVSQGGQPRNEIYDPATNTWSLDTTALDAYDSGQAFLLPDGKVLLAGGSASTGPSTKAELYTPAPPT